MNYFLMLLFFDKILIFWSNIISFDKILFFWSDTELSPVPHSIEGLICGSDIHAGGVVLVDDPFIESKSLMRAPDTIICT